MGGGGFGRQPPSDLHWPCRLGPSAQKSGFPQPGCCAAVRVRVARAVSVEGSEVVRVEVKEESEVVRVRL
eukprot:5832225-Pyramimonas_sp.AAC.1